MIKVRFMVIIIDYILNITYAKKFQKIEQGTNFIYLRKWILDLIGMKYPFYIIRQKYGLEWELR